jgi:tyrosine-protein phosphatase YwqE
VATPHIISDIYRNTPETINDALAKLRAACLAENIDIELNAAAEYMLDDYFLKLLHENTALLCIHKNIVLTELSYASSTNNLNEIAFAIMTKGYRPIMAHPERYYYYQNNYEAYTHLKDMGFFLQVTYSPLQAIMASLLQKRQNTFSKMIWLISSAAICTTTAILRSCKNAKVLNYSKNTFINEPSTY